MKPLYLSIFGFSSDEKANVNFSVSDCIDYYTLTTTLIFTTVEPAAAQNSSTAGDVCLSCGSSTGTNMTKSTIGDNATMTNTSGS